MVGGQTRTARIADLSAGGAHVHGEPALQAGVRGMRNIDLVGFPPPFSVTRGAAESTRVAFELHAATVEAFGAMPERLARRRAA